MTSQHLLVIANRTCPCPGLLEEIADRLAPGGRVLVVSPALNGRLRHWMSDSDGAVAEARDRLAGTLALLAERGIDARGEVGDGNPLLALEDALAVFPADAVVLSTHPPGRSHWLERGLVARAGERFTGPVVHLVSPYGLERPAVAA
jgi:hypothetical protein